MPDKPPSLASIQHYRMEDWGGHELYTCCDCPWDTLDDKDLMEQHQIVVHNRQLVTTAAQVEQAINRER